MKHDVLATERLSPAEYRVDNSKEFLELDIAFAIAARDSSREPFVSAQGDAANALGAARVRVDLDDVAMRVE